MITRRQEEVLKLAARGLVYEEIARIMGVSPRTIRTHMYNVLLTLDAKSRSEAIWKMGWVRLPGEPRGDWAGG